MYSILIAGGGTAGHINPAIAIADEIRRRMPDAKITFVGTPHGMEAKLVPSAGYDFESMNVAGFQRKLTPVNIKRNIQAAWYLTSATARSKKIIEKVRPDIAIGTGGYVSGPILRTCANSGIPIIIHEQNAFPGVTTKMLARHAACVMLAVEDAKNLIKTDAPMRVVGNPIRADILSYDRETARKELGVDDRPLILSFGGSLGARRINESMEALLCRSASDGRYNHIHGYGQYGAFILDDLMSAGVNLSTCPNLDVREFILDMPRCMAAADLVICRAGAITLSELQARGKPSILIPSPNVAENHQYHNAMALVKRNAAECLEESELSGEALIKLADSITGDPDRMRIMASNANKMAITDACSRIYEIMVETLEGKKPPKA